MDLIPCIVVVVFLAVLINGVRLLRWLELRLAGVQSEVPLQEAVCFRFRNRSIAVTSSSGSTWISAVVAYGIVTACAAAPIVFVIWDALITNKRLDPLSLAVPGVALLATLLVCLAWMESKRKYSVHLDTRRRAIYLRGSAAAVPFGMLAFALIKVMEYASDDLSRDIEICLVLKDNRLIFMGRLLGAAEATQTRAATIGQWIAEGTGASVSIIDVAGDISQAGARARPTLPRLIG